MSIQYKNFDTLIKSANDSIPLKKNNKFVPQHPFRCAIIGQSNTGKTNLMMLLLTDLMDYDRLYIICKSLEDQRIYQHILNISENNESIKCYGDIKDFDLDTLDANKTNIIIFDDVITEK